ncbi:MAG: 3-phosphoglycerate dehydrogenase, partial [Gammaproteobacteria bacterium]
MYKILSLNNISVEGLNRLPRDSYEIASEIRSPDAILLRSFNMHDMEIPGSLLAVARAGAGVNNIPVDALAARGIPVFNAPGANANAVKELVIAGILLAARNLCPAWQYVNGLDGEGASLNKQVEAGKKQFVGYELPSRTLGILGLGAIGVQVANTALALGMRVIGFDPQMTVQRAWELSSGVEQARSLDDLVGRCDVLTLHVPLVDATKNLINAERIGLMPAGSVILNFSRGGIVDKEAALAALDEGKLATYVTDFPSRELMGNDK